MPGGGGDPRPLPRLRRRRRSCRRNKFKLHYCRNFIAAPVSLFPFSHLAGDAFAAAASAASTSSLSAARHWRKLETNGW